MAQLTGWPVVTDDDASGQSGTALNKALFDAILAAIEVETYNVLFPTVKMKDTIGEVTAARGNKTTLDARLDIALDDDGLLRSVARASLTQETKNFGIPISSLRQPTGIPLVAAETAGTFNIVVSSNVIVAKGEVTDNETEVSVCHFQFTLPPEYVAEGAITVRLPCKLASTGSPTNNGSTIDVAVYFQNDVGTVGADLSTTTAAATFAALDTWYTKDFVITPTGLGAGDVLNVFITSSIIDSEAGAGTIVLNLSTPKVILAVKG